MARSWTALLETRQMAEHLESEHRQIALGVKPPPNTPERYYRRPFLEVVTEYIGWGRTFGRTDGKGWTTEWAERNDRILRQWSETLGIETLMDLDGILPRVEATLRQFADQGFSGRGISGRVKPLVSFCHWCIGHGYLRDNPFKGLAAIDETPEMERRALTTEEIAMLFSVAPEWRQLLYATAIITGLRVSELRRLDGADLEFQKGRLHLRWKKTKNRKAAYCSLSAKLAEQLIVFADSGAPRRLYEKAHTRRALPETPLLFVPTHAVRLL